MIGMAALSLTVALPMKRCAGLVTWGDNGVHAVIGVGTVALGGVVVAGTASAALALI